MDNPETLARDKQFLSLKRLCYSNSQDVLDTTIVMGNTMSELLYQLRDIY